MVLTRQCVTIQIHLHKNVKTLIRVLIKNLDTDKGRQKGKMNPCLTFFVLITEQKIATVRIVILDSHEIIRMTGYDEKPIRNILKL